jgi:hypothetical protein
VWPIFQRCYFGIKANGSANAHFYAIDDIFSKQALPGRSIWVRFNAGPTWFAYDASCN